MLERFPFIRRYGVRLAALAVILALYGFARLPSLDGGERARLASQFAFSRLELPVLPEAGPRRTVREVHPDLARISAWISSVGGGVAIADLDGDGLANDLCHVDTGTDLLVVAPVPGTGDRFPAFALDPAPVPYDARTTAPMGCLPGDLNEDGRMDLLVYYWGRPPIGFLGRASEALAPTAASYRAVDLVVGTGDPERWFTNAATRADFDGDGHLDIAIGNYFPDGARILDAQATDQASMQASMSRADNAGRNRILLWTGATAGAEPGVSFRDVPVEWDRAAEHGWTLALGAADLDGDLLPELYVGNDFGPDRLLHNRSRPGEVEFATLTGQRTLTTPSSKIVSHDSFKGMGVDFADLNGDGLLDIYVSNIANEWALEESHFAWMSTGALGEMKRGVAPYVDRSEPLGLSRSGWGWDARWADFNNDGVLEALQATGFLKGTVNRWPELHELAMGNDNLLHHPETWPRLQPGDALSDDQHNPFFVRSKSGRFFDLAAEIGIDEPMVTRGLAIADVDGDGDLDFAAGNQWERSFFYLNRAPAGGRLVAPRARAAGGVRRHHAGDRRRGRGHPARRPAAGGPGGRRQRPLGKARAAAPFRPRYRCGSRRRRRAAGRARVARPRGQGSTPIAPSGAGPPPAGAGRGRRAGGLERWHPRRSPHPSPICVSRRCAASPPRSPSSTCSATSGSASSSPTPSRWSRSPPPT